jgi:hypothetical protein
MTSPDLKTPSIPQRRFSARSDEKSKLHFQDGDTGNEAILAALRDYVPGTPEEKRLVRKIDFVLLPILWWMYVLAHLDRNNIANANAAGMSEDLGLSDKRMLEPFYRRNKNLTCDRIRNARFPVLRGVRDV